MSSANNPIPPPSPQKGATNNKTAKAVADVSTVATNFPGLGLVTPTIGEGSPNEARLLAAVNLAQNAPTIAMQQEAATQANIAGTTKGWQPMG